MGRERGVRIFFFIQKDQIRKGMAEMERHDQGEGSGRYRKWEVQEVEDTGSEMYRK